MGGVELLVVDVELVEIHLHDGVESDYVQSDGCLIDLSWLVIVKCNLNHTSLYFTSVKQHVMNV